MIARVAIDSFGPMKPLAQTLFLFGFALFFFGCSRLDGGASSGKPGAGGPGGPGNAPPSPVTVGEVVIKSIPVELHAFGTVVPNASVAVKSQVAGELKAVHFQKGQDVVAGDRLFTIDARPAKAERQLAEANLARDRVEYENAQLEAARQQELFEKKLVSEAQYAKARTAANALSATLGADEAAIQGAKLSVAYSAIKSPISGRTGDLLVNVGNLVKANDAVLVTINQIRPIRVVFSLPQRELPGVLRRMNAPEAEGPLVVRAFIPGDEDSPEIGRVALIDNAVDSATGTIKLWAELENASGRLWPGQLVNTVLTLATQAEAVTVPTCAVQTGQNGPYVFVVGPRNTVENRPITAERTYGDDTVVSKGLKAGERVVTDGQLRLRPGATITIRADAKDGVSKP